MTEKSSYLTTYGQKKGINLTERSADLTNRPGLLSIFPFREILRSFLKSSVSQLDTSLSVGSITTTKVFQKCNIYKAVAKMAEK